MIKRILLLVFILVLLGSFLPPPALVTIFTIGDSTMANKKAETYPETGWCQVLPLFFTESVSIKNHAVNGRSSKSFITEGRWKVVLDSLKQGDYVFIQFGHNDEKEKDSSRYTNPYTGYRRNLIKFVIESRQKGALPVLVTPIVRRNFNETGTLIDTHGAYPEVMRSVAAQLNVPLIDLQILTEEMVIRHGVEGSKSLYVHVKPGEYAFYPEGKEDNTHLSEKGAKEVARMAVNEMSTIGIPLAKEAINTEREK
jgi:lysophospholipase L1-like esterase